MKRLMHEGSDTTSFVIFVLVHRLNALIKKGVCVKLRCHDFVPYDTQYLGTLPYFTTVVGVGNMIT